MYKEMSSNNDTHFFNLAVNTNHSSVHVPTNVYHKRMYENAVKVPILLLTFYLHVLDEEAATAIRWSEYLDETFKQNYEADPALSWQYFGSSTGIMRHFPGIYLL